MDLVTIQHYLQQASTEMPNPFRSPLEILATITEEVGEVAKEVQLFEQVGTKATWSREASHEALTEELIHLLNVIFTLANHYQIDLDQAYTIYLQKETAG